MVQTPAQGADQLPPPGITIDASDRQELAASAAALRRDIDSLSAELSANSPLRPLLSDIDIFHKAVDWALRYNEFFDVKQVAFAKTLLRQGKERADQLRAGQAPWLEATGLVLRGYRSKLDGSIQPYGLVIPTNRPSLDQQQNRLLVWLAGRNEKRTELAFLAERESSPGPFTPLDTIVLHPYGRFCNANKFAGEVDVFEAMAAVRGRYEIDPNRIFVAGFSMGGASAWHLATHHVGLWCGASPGAGFAETALIDFRNDAYGSNARQTPKLPDWAIIDLDTPPGPRWPGRVVAAGFFDEEWRPTAKRVESRL